MVMKYNTSEMGKRIQVLRCTKYNYPTAIYNRAAADTPIPPQYVSIPPHPTTIIYRDASTCSGGLHQIHGCISWCSEDTYVVSFPLQ